MVVLGDKSFWFFVKRSGFCGEIGWVLDEGSGVIWVVSVVVFIESLKKCLWGYLWSLKDTNCGGCF